ncbi:serine/threonine protein phosphatase [Roseovarius sp. TE539]|uniref:metallophosphoesterase family protein n=1 Tax=Roseovarius sp. TE539 TaxID=2249812 RepID=UPI000DDD1FC3|nr:metallophosphoesterase family protein [Roseovarius sp. TE539]RBI73941.1 serine/threonine protein phosphatase [Roseovarius sp. TE539]
MTRPIYAVGDIHGQKAMLDEALGRIEADDAGRNAPVVFLGDLVDRGPDSRGVIETLRSGRAAGRNWIVLRGNHDQMFLDFLDGHSDGRGWMGENLGGSETIASYGIMARAGTIDPAAARAAIPRAHHDFLSGLPFHHLDGGLLFVHAGIAPGVALDHQAKDDLIWIREPFLSWRGPHPWLVVHGHTPLHHPAHFGNRVDLDGGAGFGRPLVPAVFEGTDCCLLTKDGRIPLRPGDA